MEPSQIPAEVTSEVVSWTLNQPDEAIFAVTERPDLRYQPPRGSFDKSLCSVCHEYVFERYVRLQGGQPVCIPCSGYR